MRGNIDTKYKWDLTKIVKNEKELNEKIERLKEKNFELRKIMVSNVLYHNPENDENVVICVL